MSELEREKWFYSSLPSKVRPAYVQDLQKKAEQFTVEMQQSNKKHASSLEGMKQKRALDIERKAIEEFEPERKYNEIVKASKHRIVE